MSNTIVLFQWVLVINYVLFWLSFTLSRRSIRSNGKTSVRTLLGVIFIFSCITIIAGLIIRDLAITYFEIMLFGGKSAIWTYKSGKAVIRERHEMYAENAPAFVHILITMVYFALLIWPTYKISKFFNSTALIEEKIEELNNDQKRL
jgi:hypothetical protein